MKVLILIALLTPSLCIAQNKLPTHSKLRIEAPSEKIIIELQGSSEFFKNKHLSNSSSTETFKLESTPFDYLDVFPNYDQKVQSVSNGKVKWTIPTKKPLSVSSSLLGTAFLFSPGDSVLITYNENVPSISGNNSDAFIFQSELLKIQGIKGPTKHPLLIKSVEEYFAWIKHLNKQTDLLLPVLDSYKDKVTPLIYQYVKQRNADWIEVYRTSAFNGLYSLFASSSANLTLSDLNNIWDSSQCDTKLGQWLRTESRYFAPGYYLYDYTRLEVRRKFNFDFTKDTLEQKKLRVEAYYNHAKTKYKGHVLERLLQYILAEEIIKEIGPEDGFTQKILQDYYSFSKMPEYKDWMKKYLEKLMALRTGQRAPHFVLADRNGNKFTRDDLKGKIALLDFWFSGCTGCKQMTPALRKIENTFKNDTNVVFVSISTDRDKNLWEKSIRDGKYTTGNAINLFTNGNGDDHMMIKQFYITGYPELVLLDTDGRILKNPVPDPRDPKEAEELVSLLKKESLNVTEKLYSIEKDGPYVLHEPGQIAEYRIEKNSLQENHIADKSKALIKVNTDQPNVTFDVKLASHFEPEKSVYARPEKIFAVSDIEGNFGPFRELLQNNGIIDEYFNWTFGKGHLVVAGDVFDRGAQVTECLWLIYDLERKAKAAGGYVHFILGNHEIMNLKGDHSYTIQKYKDNADKIGKSLVQLYNETSELGKWLRTKNIIEKLGDLLFVHAGIAPEVNEIPLSIEEINDLMRPYYAATKLDSSNKNLLILFNDKREGDRDKTSPFWFRGYYGDGDNPRQIPTTEQLGNTLQKFGVNRIITGHTIVADTISLYYNGKVINIDTPHAEGKTEALLIEGYNYFRVDKDGRKVPLPIFDLQAKLLR